MGPLIDKRTLAARLGVDFQRSDDFDRLIEQHFAEAAYEGPFAQGWPRWWASLVESVWRKLSDKDGSAASLKSLPANERVERLCEHTKLHDLYAATPLDNDGSTRYWVVCEATQRPLDPREGFVLETQRQFSWQWDKYVSFYAVRQGLHNQQGLLLTPSEHRRAKAAKKRKSL